MDIVTETIILKFYTYHLDIHAEHPEVLCTMFDVIRNIFAQHYKDLLQQLIKTFVGLQKIEISSVLIWLLNSTIKSSKVTLNLFINILNRKKHSNDFSNHICNLQVFHHDGRSLPSSSPIFSQMQHGSLCSDTPVGMAYKQYVMNRHYINLQLPVFQVMSFT